MSLTDFFITTYSIILIYYLILLTPTWPLSVNRLLFCSCSCCTGLLKLLDYSLLTPFILLLLIIFIRFNCLSICPEQYLRNGWKDFNGTWSKCFLVLVFLWVCPCPPLSICQFMFIVAFGKKCFPFIAYAYACVHTVSCFFSAVVLYWDGNLTNWLT